MKGGDNVIDVTDIIKSDAVIDASQVLMEIAEWADSLTGDLMDDVVLHTLESVVDIIIDNCEVK